MSDLQLEKLHGGMENDIIRQKPFLVVLGLSMCFLNLAVSNQKPLLLRTGVKVVFVFFVLIVPSTPVLPCVLLMPVMGILSCLRVGGIIYASCKKLTSISICCSISAGDCVGMEGLSSEGTHVVRATLYLSVLLLRYAVNRSSPPAEVTNRTELYQRHDQESYFSLSSCSKQKQNHATNVGEF